MDIRFNNLPYLHLLWGVTALLAVIIYGFIRKRRALRRFAAAELLGHLMPDVSRPRQWVKAGLLLAAAAALVLGLIDPRWGVRYEDVPRRGIDVLFVLDVSRSMLAEDVAPNRLERGKQYVRDMLEAMGGDRVGLVTFAGTAVMACPLTVNYSAFRMILEEVEAGRLPRGGSLIGDAVRVAADSFVDEIKDYKAIVVISDGEDQESFPVEAARKAWEERGIRVYTIGLGDPEQGGRIPFVENGQRRYVQHEGQEVWTRMEPATLRQMAEVAGGAFIPAATRRIDAGRIYEERIAARQMRDFEVGRIQRHNVQYQWFAGLALALLMVETLMTDRRREGDGSLSRSGGRSVIGRVSNSLRRTPVPFVVLACWLPAGAAFADDGARALVGAADRALAAGEYDRALEAYRQAEAVLPDTPELVYNRGVALYRKGEYSQAADAFNRVLAAGKPELESRARFNLGNCAYAAALEKQSEPPAAIEQLQSAITHYRDALAARPGDVDARVNIEMAQRLIQLLKEQQDEEQDEQQCDGGDENQKEGDQQEQQPPGDSQPESQPSGENQQNQSEQSEGEEQSADQKQQDQQGQKQDSRQQEGEGDPEAGQGNPDEQQIKEGELKSGQEDDDRQRQDQGEAEPARRLMTPEEAERLLQIVRDRERQRRMQQLRAQQSRQAPVERDW